MIGIAIARELFRHKLKVCDYYSIKTVYGTFEIRIAINTAGIGFRIDNIYKDRII